MSNIDEYLKGQRVAFVRESHRGELTCNHPRIVRHEMTDYGKIKTTRDNCFMPSAGTVVFFYEEAGR